MYWATLRDEDTNERVVDKKARNSYNSGYAMDRDPYLDYPISTIEMEIIKSYMRRLGTTIVSKTGAESIPILDEMIEMAEHVDEHEGTVQCLKRMRENAEKAPEAIWGFEG